MCLRSSVFIYPKQKVLDIFFVFFNLSDLSSIHSGLVFIWYFMYSACTVYWCRPFKAALIFILKWFRRKNLRRIITALNMQTKCHILVYTSSILENNIVLFFFCEYGFSLTFSIYFKKITLTLNHFYFIEKQLCFRINNNQKVTNESDSSQQTLNIFRNIIYLDKLTIWIWICTFLKYRSVISSYKDHWHDNDNGDTWHHNSEITLTLTLCCL